MEIMDEDDGEQVTASLILVAGDGHPTTKKQISLRGHLVTFGRAVTNKVVLESLQISRHHASLEYRTEKWFLKDLSTNGILINHRAYPKNDWIELQDMDIIQFIPTGVLQYRIRYTLARIPPGITSQFKQQQAPFMAGLVGLSGSSILVPNSTSHSQDSQPIEVDDFGEDSNESISLLSGGFQEELLDLEESSEPRQFEVPKLTPKKRLYDVPKSDEEAETKRTCNKTSFKGSDEEEELLELDEDESAFIRIINSIQTPEKCKREQVIKSPYKSGLNADNPETHLERVKLQLDYFTGKCKELEAEKKADRKNYEKIIDEVRSEGECYKQEFHKKVIDLLEQDFTCSICSEIFIQATVTDCGHTFCSYCIGEWTKKKTDCPICRKMVTNQAKHIEIENYLTKIHDLMSSEIIMRRTQSLKEREAQQMKAKESENKRKNANTNDYGFGPDRFVDFLAELQHINDMFGGTHRGQGFHTGGNQAAGADVPPGVAAAIAANRNAVAVVALRRRSVRTRNRIANDISVILPQPPQTPISDPVLRPPAAVPRRGRTRAAARNAHNINPFPHIQEFPIVTRFNTPISPRVITIDDSMDEGQIVPEPQPGPSRLLNC